MLDGIKAREKKRNWLRHKIDGEARVHDKYGFMVMTSEVDERGMDKSIKSFMVPKMFSRRATADSKRNAVYIIFILMKDAYKR